MDVFFKYNPELEPKAEAVFLHMNKDYSAVYEIKNNELYLIQLEYQRYNENGVLENVNWIEETFEGIKEVKLSWFTAELIIEPFTRNFEDKLKGKYEIITFVKGVVKNTFETTELGVEKIKCQLIKKFKVTQEYEQLTKDYPEWSALEIEKIIVADSILDLMTKYDE